MEESQRIRSWTSWKVRYPACLVIVLNSLSEDEEMDVDQPDGDEEQGYPLVDELFSRIEELELKVCEYIIRSWKYLKILLVVRSGDEGCFSGNRNARGGCGRNGRENAYDGEDVSR